MVAALRSCARRWSFHVLGRLPGTSALGARISFSRPARLCLIPVCAVRAAELLPAYAPSFSCAQPRSLSLRRRRSIFRCSVGRASPLRVRRVPRCHGCPVFGPRRFAFALIAIVVLSLMIALRARQTPASSPFSCSPARPLGSLGLNPYLVVDLAAT
jgi:hypothetical protein